MSYLDPEKLKAAGFTDEIAPRRAAAVVILAGLEGTGKTHWSLTAPKPLFYQSTDFGDEGVIQKFKGSGQIIRPANGDYKLEIPFELRAFVDREEKTDVRQVREGRLANFVHQNFYLPFRKDFEAALDAGVRTVVWDTALEIWEFTRLSVYGRGATNRDDLKTEANLKFKEMVRQANVRGVNLIMINHLKTKFESYFDGQGTLKWRPTAEFDMQGFDKAPFLVTSNLWTSFKGGEWFIQVKKCRDNASVVGMTLPAMDFQTTMAVLIPSVPAEQWE